MGIAGLLPLLKKASKNCHVRKLSGCTVAIDAYGWLHKGSFGCAEKLGKGEPTDAYITYCMKYIQVLLDNKVKPILVLDGRNLPSKAHTEKKRRAKREENRKLARKYLQEGKRKEAWECFTRCVDITPEMARNFIKRLRSMNIDYVVAPYEADAQLAFMAKTGMVDFIITEDSDLVLFGCPKIFFKMSVNGDGVLFDQSKLPQCLGVTSSQFDFVQFRWMCILSGCDYLPSIPGIGLGRAKKVIYASNHTDIKQMLRTISSVLDKLQVDVTDEYIDGFIQAENTFLYQLVFDTTTRTAIPLNPYPDNIDLNSLQYAGKYEDETLALGMALGNVDIHTLKTVDNFEPMRSNYPTTSIWSSSFKAGTRVITTNDAPMIGMEISTPRGSTPSTKKKRPLVVTNKDIDDNVPGDMELLNMYSVSSSLSSNKINHDDEGFTSRGIGSEEYETKPEFNDKIDSPSAAKRRRITETKTEEDRTQNSPSSNTRSSTQKRSTLPFFKSPENSRVHVKSKYFRSQSDITKKVAANLNKAKDVSDSSPEDEVNLTEENVSSNCSVVLHRLNIYSNSSSQASNYTDMSASQSSTFSQTSSAYSSYNGDIENQEDNNETEFQSNRIEMCSLSNGKTTSSPAIITLDEEEDEAYDSMGLTNVTKSFESSSISNETTGTRSSYTSSPYFGNPSKSASTTRRQGLSRNVKKTQQRSVKDMFAKQMSKG